MKKHFVTSVPSKDLYENLQESLSDTEIEIRKSLQDFEVEEVQDVNLLCKQPSKTRNCTSNAFQALKIKDEMKIDLCKRVSSPLSNIRSRHKIQTIDEVSEHSSNSSRATSSSNAHKIEPQKEIDCIMRAHRRKLRPVSRKPSAPLEDEVKLLHMSSCQSLSSIEDSEFEDRTTKKVENKDSSTSYDPPKLMISRTTQLEAGDCPELHNWKTPSKNFIRERQAGKLYDSCQDLISINSVQSIKSNSCFGCVWKPVANFCRRKQK